MTGSEYAVLLANLWLIGSIFAPVRSGGGGFWSHPRTMMSLIGMLWMLLALIRVATE